MEEVFYSTAFTKVIFSRKSALESGSAQGGVKGDLNANISGGVISDENDCVQGNVKGDVKANISDSVNSGVTGEIKGLLIKADVPIVQPDECLGLVGNVIGAWHEPILFNDEDFPSWHLLIVEEALNQMIQDAAGNPIEYKLVIVDSTTKQIKVWEEGENRILNDMTNWDEVLNGDESKNNALSDNVLEDNALILKHRFAPRYWRGVGTAVPVFSLRTEDDFGVGEFYDIKKLVDWAVLTGQSIIQILPINDTSMTGTWHDSYPYNANSTFALHPQFINLPAVGVEEDEPYKAMQRELNALSKIDYEKVNSLKRKFLRKAYENNFYKLSQSSDYKEFVKKNKYWLYPYALFCALRDEKGTANFNLWGEYSKYSQEKLEFWIKKYQEEVDFYSFIQFHLDKQLREVCEYAHSKSIVLKGDLPIGISRTSVDAWQFPELFNMNTSAGAPPDAFSDLGQNWGFPTYNWDKMAEDDFSWWKSRLGKMSEYFDAFRIDHILGFFRIWEIPMPLTEGLKGRFSPALPYSKSEIESLLGLSCLDEIHWRELFLEDIHKKELYHPFIAAHKTQTYINLDEQTKQNFNRLYEDFYYHRHNEFWARSALSKLPSLLKSTGMLACGEDLGMIPSCVPDVMRELNILSLEIQRMPKEYGVELADVSKYPYLSICTTGTHDMETLRGWKGELSADVCERILKEHLNSPSIFTIIPIQDWLSIDETLRHPNPEEERINVPANSRHYWRYRMHISLEQLLTESEFNDKIRFIIT